MEAGSSSKGSMGAALDSVRGALAPRWAPKYRAMAGGRPLYRASAPSVPTVSRMQCSVERYMVEEACILTFAVSKGWPSTDCAEPAMAPAVHGRQSACDMGGPSQLA
eukprot:scaffold12195_cov164-Isochrysis_galbana.AAC.3